MSAVSIREKRVLTWKEVVSLLGEQLYKDCSAAGWLKPCATKDGIVRDRNVFAMRDVETCEARITEGEYPQQKGGAK